jgi:hypothetical protein
MPIQPGSPAAQMPSDEGGMARRVQEIERALLELGPSIAGSFTPVIAELTELIALVVRPDTAAGTGAAFTVPNTYATVAQETLTTPAGFTKAAVVASAHVRVRNTSAGLATFALVGKINGVAGDIVSHQVVASEYGNKSVVAVGLVTDLTDGATFLIETRLYSSPALDADAGNTASIRALVLWFR